MGRRYVHRAGNRCNYGSSTIGQRRVGGVAGSHLGIEPHGQGPALDRRKASVIAALGGVEVGPRAGF